MSKKKIRLAFFGSPAFALPALKALHQAQDMDLRFVVSQPDKARSRGKMSPTPVKAYALEAGIPVLSPQSVNTDEMLDRLEAEAVDYLVVIAFGQMIGDGLLSRYQDRILNIHGSLLPAYRGAAPIQRALFDGKKETGLSAMLVEKKMDAGDVLQMVKTPISEEDDLASLAGRLSEMAVDLLLSTLRNYQELFDQRMVQDPDQVTIAKKIRKKDGILDFTKPLFLLHRQLATVKDWPGARIKMDGLEYKVYAADCVEGPKQGEIGQILFFEKEGLAIQAADGLFVIKKIQAPGKKPLAIQDFYNGRKGALPKALEEIVE